MSSPSRKAALLAVFAVLGISAFAVAGCGSDDKGDSSSGSSSTADTLSVATGGTASTATGDTASTATGGTATAPISPTDQAALSAVAGGNPSVDDVITVIHSVLLQKGLDDSVATCVEDNLRNSLSPDDVKDINGGSPPPAFQAKVQAAAQTCNVTKGQ